MLFTYCTRESKLSLQETPFSDGFEEGEIFLLLRHFTGQIIYMKVITRYRKISYLSNLESVTETLCYDYTDRVYQEQSVS